MLLYHIIQYSFLTVICTYLVHYYAGPSVSFQIKLWSVITWTLNFAIALLVPQDIYYTLNPTQDSIQHQKQLRALGWQYFLLYWLVYLLTWTIIPVLQEYENSGDLEAKDRLKRSLKVNGVFYLWIVIGGVIALIVLIWLKAGGDMGIVKFLQCLATIWGLFLLMILIGYALVEIPKTLWNNADPNTFLAYLYRKTDELEDSIQQSKQQLTKITGYILYLQTQTTLNPSLYEQTAQIQLYCSQSLKLVPSQYQQLINRKKQYSEFLGQIGYLDSYPVCLQSAIEHLRLVKRIVAQCRRLERTFRYYCHKAILYEDIVEALKQGKGDGRGGVMDQIKEEGWGENKAKTNDKVPTGSNTSLEEQMLYNKYQEAMQKHSRPTLKTPLFEAKWYHSLWYLKVRPTLNRFLALVIGLCSLILLLSQTQVFLTPSSSLLAYLLHIHNYQTLRIICFLVMLFIMYMANYSLFRLKLSNLYGLYYKDSDGPSMMFATVNFSRVGVVIVMNFFDMMKVESQYKKVMGTVDMGLLGEWVMKGLPGILWLMVLTHYFNVWGKIMDMLKLNDSFSFNSHDTTKNINVKGLKTVQKKRALLQKQKLTLSSPKK